MGTVKASGSTMEKYWRRKEDMKKLGEYSETKLKEYFLKVDLIRGLEPLDGDESNSFTINTNETHKHVVPEISRILNLPKVERIDTKLAKSIAVARWKQYNKLANGGSKKQVFG